jgi:hypothetical protein
MAEQRRVVVTGLGLICGVGNTAPAVWEGLLAGKSGMAEITAYDLEGHSVRFAAEVKDFDPHVFVDKKEARKMGRSRVQNACVLLRFNTKMDVQSQKEASDLSLTTLVFIVVPPKGGAAGFVWAAVVAHAI